MSHLICVFILAIQISGEEGEGWEEIIYFKKWPCVQAFLFFVFGDHALIYWFVYSSVYHIFQLCLIRYSLIGSFILISIFRASEDRRDMLGKRYVFQSRYFLVNFNTGNTVLIDIIRLSVEKGATVLWRRSFGLKVMVLPRATFLVTNGNNIPALWCQWCQRLTSCQWKRSRFPLTATQVER